MTSLAVIPAARAVAGRGFLKKAMSLLGPAAVGAAATSALDSDSVRVEIPSPRGSANEEFQSGRQRPAARLRSDFRSNLEALQNTKLGKRFVKDAENQQTIENMFEFAKLYLGLVASSPMFALVNAWIAVNGLEKLGALSNLEGAVIKGVIGTQAGLAAAGPLGALALAGVAAASAAPSVGSPLKTIGSIFNIPGVPVL